MAGSSSRERDPKIAGPSTESTVRPENGQNLSVLSGEKWREAVQRGKSWRPRLGLCEFPKTFARLWWRRRESCRERRFKNAARSLDAAPTLTERSGPPSPRLRRGSPRVEAALAERKLRNVARAKAGGGGGSRTGLALVINAVIWAICAGFRINPSFRS